MNDLAVIDTLRYSDRLKDAGIPATQAEAMSRALNDEMTSGLATKSDIDKLDGRVERVEVKLDAVEAKVDSLGTRLDALEVKVDALDARLDAVEVKVDALDTRLHAVEAKVDAIAAKLDTMGRYVFLVLALIVALGLYNTVAPRLHADSSPAVAAETAKTP